MESYNGTFILQKDQGRSMPGYTPPYTQTHVHTELNARLTSEAFYNGEVESELRLLEKEYKVSLCDIVIHQDSDRDQIMKQIEFIRSHSIYPHNSCTAACKDKGISLCTLFCTYSTFFQVADVFGSQMV